MNATARKAEAFGTFFWIVEVVSSEESTMWVGNRMTNQHGGFNSGALQQLS